MRPGHLLEAAQSGDVLGVADEDGSVTYYRAALEAPRGDRSPGDLPRASGRILEDRVWVADPAAKAWSEREFLGTPHGSGLMLSFAEAEHLRRRGVLALEGDVAATATARQAWFGRTMPAYEALRGAGVVAKSGFRFGTHLRAYRGDPDEEHADWLVHCPGPGGLEWPDLSRGVRLAHGVRKRFLVFVEGRFVGLEWFRP